MMMLGMDCSATQKVTSVARGERARILIAKVGYNPKIVLSEVLFCLSKHDHHRLSN